MKQARRSFEDFDADEDADDDLEMDLQDDDDDDFRDSSVQRPLKSFSDRLIADFASELRGPDVLVLLMHGTTLASALRDARPDLNFTFFTPEHFFYRTLERFHGEHDTVGREAPDSAAGKKVVLVCAADPPQADFDEVLFPTRSGDSSEVAQDLFQTAHVRLKSGGRLIVSTNNPKDRWIPSQLKPLFSSVVVHKHKHGVVCIATRSSPLKKIRGFRARSAYRFGERLVCCESRPGVFCHRRIDAGARALIKSLSLLKPEKSASADAAAAPASPAKLIDMGCGYGAVAMALAIQFPEARMLAVDSDARAIECTQNSAALNKITTIETLLTSDGKIPEPGTWDLLVGNPPYYSDFRISELFLQAARSALKPGGRIHLVTKLLDWHEARMKQLFADVEAHRFGEYTVFTASQKRRGSQ